MCGSGFSGNVHFSSIQILEQCLKIPTCITAGALFSTRPRKFSGISEQSAIHTLFNWSLQRKRQRHHQSSKSECSDCLLGSDSDVLRRLRLAMWKNCATKATERHLGQIAPEQSDMANQSHLGHCDSSRAEMWYFFSFHCDRHLDPAQCAVHVEDQVLEKFTLQQTFVKICPQSKKRTLHKFKKWHILYNVITSVFAGLINFSFSWNLPLEERLLF